MVSGCPQFTLIQIKRRAGAFGTVRLMPQPRFDLLGHVHQPAQAALWMLMHAAAIGVGLWLIWRGRQPAWMDRLGRVADTMSAPPANGWH